VRAQHLDLCWLAAGYDVGVGGGDLRAFVRSPVIRPCPLASTPLDQIINTISSRPLADYPAKVDTFRYSASITREHSFSVPNAFSPTCPHNAFNTNCESIWITIRTLKNSFSLVENSDLRWEW
jgi:hypothetical protein